MIERQNLNVENSGFTGGEDLYQLRYPEKLVEKLKANSLKNEVIEIVDLGSASGNVTNWIALQDSRFRVVGLERDSTLVAKAEERGKQSKLVNLSYKTFDIKSGLPFADKSLNAVVMHRLRDSIMDPVTREALTHELARVLKKGGLVSLMEDLYVETTDPEGEWYARRYALSKKIISRLIEIRKFPGFYKKLLENTELHLLLSVRLQDGIKIDELSFESNENEFVEKILDGTIIIRATGIHQTKESVIDDFNRNKLHVVDQWVIQLPEKGTRAGHFSVMKGILFQNSTS